VEEWSALEAWWRANVPEALRRLGAPADASTIDAAEREMGVELPADYRAWLLAHDGADDGLFGDQVLSIGETLGTWRFLTEMFATPVPNPIDPDPGVRAAWWHRGWIPITSDGAGNRVCIDLDPASGGTRGQLVKFWHDGGDRPLVAASVGAWFAMHRERLQTGEVVVLADEDGRFDGVLPRTSLTGSLATCRIRGESEDAYRARVDQEKHRNRGWVLADIIAVLLRYKLIELVPGAFHASLSIAIGGSMANVPWWALHEKLHRAIGKHRDVAAVHVTAEKLRELLDAFPRVRDILGERPSFDEPLDET